MSKVERENLSLLKDVLNDVELTRRSFLIKTGAAAGTAAAIGGTLKPTLKALAEVGESSNKDLGEWKAATCQGCTSWCSDNPVNQAGHGNPFLFSQSVKRRD